MKMMIPILFTLLATAHARLGFQENPIRLHSDGLGRPDIDCVSWKWAAETNNARDWSVVPDECVSSVADYVNLSPLGGLTQYQSDIRTVVSYASTHLTTLNPSQNGKDIWIFDLDETLLSDLPYYRRPDVNYGGFPFDEAKFNEWIAAGELPGIEDVVALYNEVLNKGFKIVIISGTSDDFREARYKNLRNVGVDGWEKLILWTEADNGKTALQYKSEKKAELVKEGYTIVGNIGDQWSDLSGPAAGARTFKVPNPMYYVA